MSLVNWLISSVRPFVDRFPRIAGVYRTVRDQLDFMKEPIITPWGFKLAGNSDMARGRFEPVETELIRTILKEVDILVNVGANIGYYCCHALSMGKQVIAFEPVQRNLRYLCKNIKVNGWTGVEIFPIALSNCVGILELYGNNTAASVIKGWEGTSENYVTLVPSSTLDLALGIRLQGKRVLVLVDIEGAEKWMLDGATRLLASAPKPIWIVEIKHMHLHQTNFVLNPNFLETFQIFFQNGYKVFVINQDIRPITMEHVELIIKGEQKIETHNFLFREHNGE